MTRPRNGRTSLPAAILCALLAAGCGDEPRQPEAGGAAPVPVTTVPAARVEAAERLEAGGLVAAGESAAISSRVLAPVVEVRVQAGDRVRRGQPLVVLDDRQLGAEARGARAAVAGAEQALAAARSDRSAAEAEQTLATAWHARISSLQARNSATPQELDEATARLSAATARTAGASARIAQATAQLDAARAAAEGADTVHGFATIQAPFDGVVTERLIDPGNLAAPGTPLLRLDSTGARTVVAQVDAARTPYIAIGARVDVLFDAAEDRSGEARAIAGVVTEIARTVSADQRSFAVEVSLPPDVTARAGTFARVRFPGPVRQALVVPADAIRRQGQVTSVFVVHDGIARLRLVRTGALTDAGVEVLAGLEAGELVVTHPPPALADGHAVVATPTSNLPGDRP